MKLSKLRVIFTSNFVTVANELTLRIKQFIDQLCPKNEKTITLFYLFAVEMPGCFIVMILVNFIIVSNNVVNSIL